MALVIYRDSIRFDNSFQPAYPTYYHLMQVRLAKRNRTFEMPLSRSFRESTASVRGKMGVAVIAGESIYANVRLHLAANRIYGL